MLRYKTETRPGLVALYDIRPGNGAGQFLQPRSPNGAHHRTKRRRQTFVHGRRHHRTPSEEHAEDLVVDVDGPRLLTGDHGVGRAVADSSASTLHLVPEPVRTFPCAFAVHRTQRDSYTTSMQPLCYYYHIRPFSFFGPRLL